jgi:hypothetical protein
MGDSPRRSVKESARREHLILARIKGELHPCAGAPTRTGGEWRLSDILGKYHRVPNPLHSSNLLSLIAFVAWCFQSAMHAIAARAGTKSLVMEAGAVRLIW